ncbi:MAG: ABC transporter permease [Candidatus Rokuibacteriota bacterium]
MTAGWRVWLVRLVPVWALGLALTLGALLIVAAGGNPFVAYWAVLEGAFGDVFGFGSTLTKMAPILLAGLGVALALRGGLFNIGAEGQIYLGGLAAAWVGLYVSGLPSLLHVPLALLASAVGGGLWALIPAWLRVRRGVNEVITTLLMNYVAIYGVSYVVNGPMMEPGAPYPYSPPLLDTARLPLILPEADAHAGILLGLAAAVVLHVILARTAAGYRIQAVGLNPQAAAYGGLGVARTMIGVMLASGALAGLAGAGEVMGLKHRLFDRFSPGYGFDAIAAAFLAGSQPLLVVPTALFFGALRSGGSLMQRAVGTPVAIVIVIQGLAIFFLTLGLVIAYWGPTRRFLQRGAAPLPPDPATAVPAAGMPDARLR